MDSAALRVVFDHRIEKLTLPSGIPELLHSTNQIQHRSTIKVVTVAPIVLTLFPPNESFTGCDITDQSLDTTSSTRTTIQHSSDTSDSSASTVILSQNNSPERKPWPKEFIIPHFSVETEMVLERANELYRKDGTVLTTPKVKSDILEKLAQSIYTYSAYPSTLQILSVAEALIKAHPCLKDRGSFSGFYAWQTSIKYKMANYRTKLRGFGISEVTCNALKHKHPDDRKSAKNVKRPRRAEVNYLPSYPVGEDEKTLEKEREELVSEFKKKNNERMIKEKMNKTFAHRRHEIINQCPSVQNTKERWPALFQPSQVIAEFQRITTVQLEAKLMSSLDLHTPKLLTLFRGKGGALGERLKTEMELLKDEQCSVDMTREVVIHCIIEFLGEHAGDLIKEFKRGHDIVDWIF
ncbi:sterile alpha motif domain-containing protein 3-like [Sinocyclocheilus anshuiensis]|uniref:sterile alpha motif domain-containing protein 3-like n=1 Tax=Sinocyclocheilus anshuiensis TaxID=1608454 RepID=UPI0007B92CE6|nr:PREDICTED: sterile alpha motif domain-containing protein 3-like [Sinocyclocheilus anshuiensis]